MEYSKETIDLVWEMGFEIEGKDPSLYRMDKCGATMKKDCYNSTKAQGWVVNHIHPISCGGIEYYTNYQPLHWRNHESKGEGPDFPNVYCVYKQ